MPFRLGPEEWTGKMAEFGIGLQEESVSEVQQLRFSRKMLTEIGPLAEAEALAHKDKQPKGREQFEQ